MKDLENKVYTHLKARNWQVLADKSLWEEKS